MLNKLSFYYKYSNYSSTQIIDERYSQIAELIMKLAKTNEHREKLHGILYDGGIDEFSVNLDNEYDIPHKDSPHHESQRRIQYAYFLANNPEAFETISKNNATLFHGTKVDALPSILKHGMNSLAESTKNGIEVSTGEEWSRIPGKLRNFISFTDHLGVALRYSQMSGQNKETDKDSFGVIVGMSPESTKQLDLFPVNSDVLEIGIMDHIPLDCISVLTVPTEKVEFVRKLVGERPIEVVGAQMQDPFYQMKYYEMPEYLMNLGKNEPAISNEYTEKDMQSLAKTRGLSKIKEFFNNLNKFLSKGGRNNQNEEYNR